MGRETRKFALTSHHIESALFAVVSAEVRSGPMPKMNRSETVITIGSG